MAVQFGGGEQAEAVAREWIREALVCAFQVQDPAELPKVRRAFALQRMLGVLFALEDDAEDFAFAFNTRHQVAQKFGQLLDGCLLDGPPWRLDPGDTAYPPYDVWALSASF